MQNLYYIHLFQIYPNRNDLDETMGLPLLALVSVAEVKRNPNTVRSARNRGVNVAVQNKLSFRDTRLLSANALGVGSWRCGPDRRSDANACWRLDRRRRTVSAAMDGTAHTLPSRPFDLLTLTALLPPSGGQHSTSR